MEINPWIPNLGIRDVPVGLNRGDLIDVVYSDGSEIYGMTALINSYSQDFKKKRTVGDKNYCARSWTIIEGSHCNIVKWRYHTPSFFPTRESARLFCQQTPGYSVTDRGIGAENRWGIKVKNAVVVREV